MPLKCDSCSFTTPALLVKDNCINVSEILKHINDKSFDRSFSKGEHVWFKSDRNSKLIYIVSGKIKTYNILPNGKEVVSFIFPQGSMFGFMPMIDEEPYPNSAIAVEKTETKIILKNELMGIIKENPEITFLLMKLLSHRLRETLSQIDIFSSNNSSYRVAMAFLSLRSKPDIKDGTINITLPVSSKEFSSLIGVTPESFSRVITQFITQKIITKVSAHSFILNDFKKLKALIS